MAPVIFKAPTRDPACYPLFKIFVSSPLFSVVPPFKLFQTVPPTHTEPSSALI